MRFKGRGLPARLFVFLALLLPGLGVAQEQLKLVVPGCPWALAFPKAGFELKPAEISPDGRQGYFLAFDERSGFTVSFFIEPAGKCKSSRECRDMLQKSGFAHLGKVENVHPSEIGDVSVVECFVTEYKGIPAKQQNLFAEYVVQGYWVDARVSKTQYTPQDHAVFEKLVRSIAFVPKGEDSAAGKTLTIFENRQIAVNLPRGWSYTESRDPESGLQTIAMADPKGDVSLQVSFLPDSKGKLASRTGLEAMMRQAFEPYRAGAVEKELQFTFFDGPGGVGGYTVFTDRELVGKKPPEGQWLLSTTGMRSWPGAFLTFTLLSNSKDTDAYRQALELAKTGVREISAASARPKA